MSDAQRQLADAIYASWQVALKASKEAQYADWRHVEVMLHGMWAWHNWAAKPDHGLMDDITFLMQIADYHKFDSR